MDSADLIARENEFKKLNKQLEKKTESLMKEIQEVMQKPDIFSTNMNLKLNLYNSNTTKKHQCFTPKSSPSENCAPRYNLCDKSKDSKLSTRKVPNLNTPIKNVPNKELKQNCEIDMHRSQNRDLNVDKNCANRVMCDCCSNVRISEDLEFLYAFVSVNVKDNVLPQSFLKGKVTVESVCKCLSAKIKLMQEQIDKLQTVINKKHKTCEAHLTHIAELESERLSLLNTANSMKSDTADMKAKYLAIQARLDEKDRLHKEQRSASDKLSVEVKRHRTKLSSLEARCATQEDLIASLKQQLEAAKLAEKEYRSSTRSLSASHEITIRQLQSQVTALCARAAQYRALIANLRSQRALLTARRAADTYNSQYCQLLEGEYDAVIK